MDEQENSTQGIHGNYKYLTKTGLDGLPIVKLISIIKHLIFTQGRLVTQEEKERIAGKGNDDDKTNDDQIHGK